MNEYRGPPLKKRTECRSWLECLKASAHDLRFVIAETSSEGVGNFGMPMARKKQAI